MQVVYAEVEFEECPAQALVDTGSPATIVSLVALSALAKKHPKTQSPSKWEMVVKRRLQQPTISYRGEQLNIV